jgi:hypothetical protein
VNPIGSCDVCCQTRVLHRHHRKYRSRRQPGEDIDDPRNVALVCYRCHADIHAHRGDWTRDFRTYSYAPIGESERETDERMGRER